MACVNNNNIRPLLGAGQEEYPCREDVDKQELTTKKRPGTKPVITFNPEMKVYRNGGKTKEEAPAVEPKNKTKRLRKDFTKLEEIEADCQIMRAEIRKMDHRLEEIMNAARDCGEFMKGSNQNLSLDDEMVQRMEQAKLKAASNLDVVHRIMAKRPPMIIESEQALAEWDDSAPLYRDIQAVVDSGSLYVRTPPLYNRNRHWVCETNVDYYRTFASVVKRKVLRILGELPPFIEKNITMIASYPKDAYYIPDTDNLDTKSVVDAIVGNIAGEDSAVCCTFFSASILNDILPWGVYFTVSEGFAKVPDFTRNIQKLENLFGLGT